MRAVVLAFAVCAVLAGQTPPVLDIVLLVEDAIPVTLVGRTDLNTLGPGDRLALMTFSKNQSLKLALEGDFRKEFRAIRKLDSRGTSIHDSPLGCHPEGH